MKESLTNWFCDDVSEPKPSVPNTNADLEEGAFCCRVDTVIISPGVCVDGVEGELSGELAGELAGGPVVFAVPELMPGPEDDADFRFRTNLVFGALNTNKLIKIPRYVLKPINAEQRQ